MFAGWGAKKAGSGLVGERWGLKTRAKSLVDNHKPDSISEVKPHCGWYAKPVKICSVAFGMCFIPEMREFGRLQVQLASPDPSLETLGGLGRQAVYW